MLLAAACAIAAEASPVAPADVPSKAAHNNFMIFMSIKAIAGGTSRFPSEVGRATGQSQCGLSQGEPREVEEVLQLQRVSGSSSWA